MYDRLGQDIIWEYEILNYLISFGTTRESTVPHTVTSTPEYYNRQYPAGAEQEARLIDLDDYWPLEPHVDQIQAIKGVIYNQHRPLVCTVTLDMDFHKDYRDNFPSSGTYVHHMDPNNIWMPHVMTIVGYDDTKYYLDDIGTPHFGAYRIRNQWGTGFADSGYFWLSYDSYWAIKCFVVNEEFNEAALQTFVGPDILVYYPPPTHMCATCGNPSQVDISWKCDSIDILSQPDLFRIYRDTKTNLLGTVLGNVYSYTDTTAQQGYAHTYWIEAVWLNLPTPDDDIEVLSRPEFGYVE